jgi:hypothetical protein
VPHDSNDRDNDERLELQASTLQVRQDRDKDLQGGAANHGAAEGEQQEHHLEEGVLGVRQWPKQMRVGSPGLPRVGFAILWSDPGCRSFQALNFRATIRTKLRIRSVSTESTTLSVVGVDKLPVWNSVSVCCVSTR